MIWHILHCSLFFRRLALAVNIDEYLLWRFTSIHHIVHTHTWTCRKINTVQRNTTNIKCVFNVLHSCFTLSQLTWVDHSGVHTQTCSAINTAQHNENWMYLMTVFVLHEAYKLRNFTFVCISSSVELPYHSIFPMRTWLYHFNYGTHSNSNSISISQSNCIVGIIVSLLSIL